MTVPFKFSCTLLPSSKVFMTPTLRPARSTASAVLMTRFGFAGGSSALHDAAFVEFSGVMARVAESSLNDSYFDAALSKILRAMAAPING